MNEVLHANIFFLITGIAVIVCTFLLSIALFHFIKVLQSIRRITDRVERGTMTLAEDIEQLRTYVIEESFLSRFFKHVFPHSETKEEEDVPLKKTSLRSLKPERRGKTEIKIKNQE